MGEEMAVLEIVNRPPHRLYRYRASRTLYFLDEIKQALAQNIYVTPYSGMNDPFEASPAIIASTDREVTDFVRECKKKNGRYALPTGTNAVEAGRKFGFAKKSYKNKFPTTYSLARYSRSIVPKLVARIRTGHSIASFSEVPDSLLMWAHYGGAHGGIVMEYEFDEGPARRGDSRNPVRVRYNLDRPKLTELEILKFACRVDGMKEEDLKQRVFEGVWLTKSRDWAYEKEWRVICMRASGYEYVPSLKLSRIILGPFIEENVKGDVFSAVGDRVQIDQVELHQEEFSLKV